MRRSTSDWEEEFESRPVPTTLKFWFWTVGILLATGMAVTAILWGTGVWTAPWKGKGDAYQQKYSSSNWVSAQRGFLDKFNQVQAFRVNLKTARQQLADFDQKHPNVDNGTPYDPLLQQRTNLDTTVTGLSQQCQATVADYNSDARAYLTEEFRDANLPASLDPATCDG